MHPIILKEPKGCLSVSLAGHLHQVNGYCVGSGWVEDCQRDWDLQERWAQHGFRQCRSCLTNLLEFFGQVYQEYNECKAMDLIYLDFQKAFDNVLHERLLLKVASMGIASVTAIFSTGFVPGFPDVDSVYALVEYALSGCQLLQAYPKVVCFDRCCFWSTFTT